MLTAPLLEGIAAAYGTPEFEEVFHSLYPKCENISVDYAVLEPRSAKGEHLSHLYCIPAEFSWNDLGSWAALYEYQLETRLRGDGEGNVSETEGHTAIDAGNNYIYSPRKSALLCRIRQRIAGECRADQKNDGLPHSTVRRKDLETPGQAKAPAPPNCGRRLSY